MYLLLPLFCIYAFSKGYSNLFSTKRGPFYGGNKKDAAAIRAIIVCLYASFS
jgi:hypothetical protein